MVGQEVAQSTSAASSDDISMSESRLNFANLAKPRISSFSRFYVSLNLAAHYPHSVHQLSPSAPSSFWVKIKHGDVKLSVLYASPLSVLLIFSNTLFF